MQGTNGQLSVFLLNYAGDLDLRGGDHQDIDALIRHNPKHGGGNTRVVSHTHANNGDFDDGFIPGYRFGPNLLGNLLQYLHGAGIIGPHNRKGHIGQLSLAGILDDHIHQDPSLGDGLENLGGYPGLIRNLGDGDTRFILVIGNAGNQHGFHNPVLLNDPGAFIF